VLCLRTAIEISTVGLSIEGEGGVAERSRSERDAREQGAVDVRSNERRSESQLGDRGAARGRRYDDDAQSAAEAHVHQRPRLPVREDQCGRLITLHDHIDADQARFYASRHVLRPDGGWYESVALNSCYSFRPGAHRPRGLGPDRPRGQTLSHHP
jgi:hypothetical protein